MLDHQARARPTLQQPLDVRVAAGGRRDVALRGGESLNIRTGRYPPLRAPRAGRRWSQSGRAGAASAHGMVLSTNSNRSPGDPDR
jgi:hypothetical protein